MGRRRRKTKTVEPGVHDPETVMGFFAWSDSLDHDVLRPLSHITSAWEMWWDREAGCYEPEPGTFAADLNAIIDQIASTPRPDRYHDHEDALAESVIRDLKWPIQKKGSRWTGADYEAILEQGAFSDFAQQDLASSAAGRVHAALDRGQLDYDHMDESHAHMLAAIMTIMLYHRYSDGSAFYRDSSAAA